jgi:hypothetical protein
MKEKVHKIASLILILAGAFLAFSCSTTKNGFLQPSSTYNPQEAPSQMDLDVMIQKKEKLNTETETIMSSMKKSHETLHAIGAKDINGLFQNLKNQYNTDRCFQHIFMHAANDSVKRTARQNLIRATDFYHTNFQEEKWLRRIINRGDEGILIEENTHLRSQQFLWKRKSRNQKMEPNLKLTSSGKTRFDFIRQTTSDKIYRAFYKTFGLGSRLFGHSLQIAHFKSRTEKNKSILPHLKKWDIVCMKSPYRLTDKFIPGYFGHVGIYLGDNFFVESTQKGVKCTDFQNFAEGNIFAVIRPKAVTNNQNKRMLQVVKAQMGKNYDFNFNIESPDQLFCTELIYLVYEQITWKTKRIAGHFTISPDDLILEALENNNLFIPLYLKNGQLIKNPNHSILKKILR